MKSETLDIAHAISELLFANDCVIVPGFGGFVGHYSPAKIHPVSHSFLPPSKNILFNSKLVRDDGLLTDHIAQQLGIGYAHAKARVEEFAQDLAYSLSTGEMTRLKGIGTLQMDSSGKLLFNPDESVNYLEEAFGLPGFVSPPIRRHSMPKRADKGFIDRKPATQLAGRPKSRVWAYAAATPVLLLLGWFLIFGNANRENTQQSSIFPLSETEVERSAEMTASRPDNPPLESLDFSTSDADGKEAAETADPVPPEPPLVIKKFYIIGGAFEMEANAEKLLAIMRQKGYAAERAGLSPSGLHMVSYFSSVDRNEALVNLEAIRNRENPSAWLIRK